MDVRGGERASENRWYGIKSNALISAAGENDEYYAGSLDRESQRISKEW